MDVISDFDGEAAAETVRVVYGSDAVLYAKIQHDGEFHHPSLGFHGASKFLTTPVQLNLGFYMEVFTLEVQRRLPRALIS